MASKRERYERANMRGGLGVRKRLSEESLRDSYKLNGVRTGMAVARCLDRYARWEHGYTIGVVVRKTASVVQVRWADSPDEIKTYDQGDARYEVDRGRWRILGLVQGNPLDPDNPIAVALTMLRENARIGASGNSESDTPPTEEKKLKKQISHAAQEREQAKRALANGNFQERETYTAKQVASRCGTDPKTMRKFFRSKASTVEPVGQGGRYDFAAEDLTKIKREFDAWRKKSSDRQQKPIPTPKTEPVKEDISMDRVADAIERSQEDTFGEDPYDPRDDEPSDDDIAELEGEELDLDDLDED